VKFRLLLVIAVIVYLSLYPWSFNFAVHANPLEVLLHSWPDEMDAFALRDAAINIAFYVPLGLAAFLAFAPGRSRAVAVGAAFLLGLLLSIAMELAQVYVPTRVSSMADVLFNCVGTLMGALTALRFQAMFEALTHRSYRQFACSSTLLLACWAGYHLYPFFPFVNTARLGYEMHVLLHPDSLLAAEILANTAEWFTVALALDALFGRLRLRWIVLAVCLRIAVRPILITRPFGLDEFLGAALVLPLWVVFGRKARLRAGLFLLAGSIVLRELTRVHFSHLPEDFSPVSVLFRRAFDGGGVVWLLNRTGLSYARAGIPVVATLAVFAGMQRYLAMPESAIPDAILTFLMVLGLWSIDRYDRRLAGKTSAASVSD
jgi:VanZ family protein